MRKDKQPEWYAPLLPQFQRREDAMPVSRFAAVEATLHLLSLCEPDADPRKAYYLFTQYQLIGATSCTAGQHTLQRARYALGYYRSQKCWRDDLRAYRRPCHDAFRAFAFEEKDGALSFSRAEEPYPYPYKEREKEWERFWPEDVERLNTPAYAEKGTYRYEYPNPGAGETDTARVRFEKTDVPPARPVAPEKGRRPPILIPLDELLAAARKMAEICPGDPCYAILKTNMLKQVAGARVEPCAALTLCEVVNIVGMVGAGKSTLIKVLSFWCHQNGYRIAVVVDTVAEVLNLHSYLSAFGIACSPVIGRNERLKYVNQFARRGETCLAEGFSRYLTPACLIDGMDQEHAGAISFGKEPCYTLKKGGKNHLCPYFDRCSGTRMARECYTSSVVVTTVAGFATSRVGHTRETFLEVVMRAFDLAVFDESDRAQKALDLLFMPGTRFNDYIRECAGDCRAFMEMSSKAREGNPAAQRYDELQRQSVIVLSCIVKSLRRNLGPWKKIANGDPFSALTLLENLYREDTSYSITRRVYEEIYRLIDAQDDGRVCGGMLWAAMESSCKSVDDSLFNLLYRMWRDELGDGFVRGGNEHARRIQDERIKLILRLIYFDRFIRGLSDAYEESHETAYGQNELFSFLQTRFRQQQMLLPSAVCGNLFGLKKTDDEDLVLFRQFAFGRSLMKDLPYLRTDAQGNAAGPHVMLLSGSSWAEGSYEYHVNRPVNYILEADAEKRSFLERTRFFESGFPERVSGAADELRMTQLRAVMRKAIPLIVREYERRAGKILLVVSSYAQAREVQGVLKTALRGENCPARVCAMVSDAAASQGDRATVRRGEVKRFAQMDEEILIAPAMAIERGHNIVDEYGHSALSAVFFMVRPMAVPDDIEQKGSKLNGFVEAHGKPLPGESLFARNARVRQLALGQWAKMSRSKPSGLSELDEHERRDVVATLFVLILQIFGRLARVTDVTRPEPHVYFIDGAFRGREGKRGDFDCLCELGRYLDALMTRKESAEIAQTLYAPFYHAYRKDIQYERYDLSAGV